MTARVAPRLRVRTADATWTVALAGCAWTSLDAEVRAQRGERDYRWSLESDRPVVARGPAQGHRLVDAGPESVVIVGGGLGALRARYLASWLSRLVLLLGLAAAAATLIA